MEERTEKIVAAAGGMYALSVLVSRKKDRKKWEKEWISRRNAHSHLGLVKELQAEERLRMDEASSEPSVSDCGFFPPLTYKFELQNALKPLLLRSTSTLQKSPSKRKNMSGTGPGYFTRFRRRASSWGTIQKRIQRRLQKEVVLFLESITLGPPQLTGPPYNDLKHWIRGNYLAMRFLFKGLTHEAAAVALIVDALGRHQIRATNERGSMPLNLRELLLNVNQHVKESPLRNQRGSRSKLPVVEVNQHVKESPRRNQRGSRSELPVVEVKLEESTTNLTVQQGVNTTVGVNDEDLPSHEVDIDEKRRKLVPLCHQNLVQSANE
ncbi:hypothetical protein GE061_012413 [Apolygus lucorum]|uniref:Uncharacterized protein n=1 Tax=Apolygus lucorum TaxID=248454 RepID=A0A8S9XUX7_APOLU|nr:hypothetical protein GE061_012413 [Apolygus lucorum]